MITGKDGEKLYKRIELRFVLPEGHKGFSKFIHSASKQGFTKESIDNWIDDKLIEEMDKRWPYWNFRMVTLAPNKFNFVYAGLREASAVA